MHRTSRRKHEATTVFLVLETMAVLLLAGLTRSPWIIGSFAFVIWSLGLALNHSFRDSSRLPTLSSGKGFLHRLRSVWKSTTATFSRAILLVAGICAVTAISLSLPSLFSAFPSAPHAADSVPPLVPVALLLAGGILAFLEIYRSLAAQSDSEITPAAAARLGHWRLLSVLHLLAAAVLFAEVYLKSPFHHFLAMALMVLTVASIAETAIRAIARLYVPRRLWHQSAPLGTFFFTRFWGAPYNAAFPAKEKFEDEFSLQLPEMWMWPTVRRALLPMVLVVGGMAWLASGIHEIPNGHLGLHRRLGALDDSALKPGLHFTLPRPFSSVERVSTAKVETLTIGFESDPGEPILWEKSHYVGEEHVLVGSGDDLLAISVPILYRIADPVAHAKHVHFSRDWLASLARQALLHEAVRLSSFEIMTTRREELRALLKMDLQAVLDTQESGIEIVEVYLRDIHPPIEVAGSFQEVMAAMEDKEAQIHSAEARANETLPRARATAFSTELEAAEKGKSRVLQVLGQADRFTRLAAAYNSQPEIYRIRETFLALDETLSGAKKLVMDTSFKNELPAFVDLRKVLNPDFSDPSLPEVQRLVPDLETFRTSFDLEVDGFLKRGKGEMPAPVMPDLTNE